MSAIDDTRPDERTGYGIGGEIHDEDITERDVADDENTEAVKGEA